jgi:thioredoxin-related protein
MDLMKTSIIISTIGLTIFILAVISVKYDFDTSKPEIPWENCNVQETPSTKQVPDQVKPQPKQVKSQPKSYPEALGQLKKENKMLLIFYSQTCEPCNEMKSTYNDPKVKEALRTVGVDLFYYIDVNGPEKSHSVRYRIKSIPSYAIVDYEENVVKGGAGFLNSDKFIFWITKK